MPAPPPKNRTHYKWCVATHPTSLLPEYQAAPHLPAIGHRHAFRRCQLAFFRAAFQADVVSVAEFVGLFEDSVVVDFSRAGLVAAGVVGEL